MSYARKGIVRGALILTAASVITRLLGFVYRVYMAGVVGAEGMGLYQLIMPVYSLAWALSCAGFTTTVSKIVSAENARNEHGNMGRALKQSLAITLSMGLILMCALYLGASWVGGSVLGDARAVLPLRVLAGALPFMAAGSCVRGYFLGLHEARVPAISQVIEQCARMAVIFFLAPMMARGLQYAAAAAVLGIVGGEAISFLYVAYSYRAFKLKHKMVSPPTTPPPAMLGMILAAALPLTANRVTGSLLSMAENILIPGRLQLSGMTRAAAMAAYGRVTGMAMPLIFFPSALLVSLSISLVPAISEAIALGDERRVTETTTRTLLFTGVLAMGAAAIFVAFHDELGEVIYHQDIRQPLLFLGLMCPMWYLGLTFNGILNGLGQQGFLFRNSLLSSLITISCVYLFVPVYGVNAFLAGWFVSLLVTSALCLFRVRHVTGARLRLGRCFLRPALAAAAAGLAARLAHGWIALRFERAFSLVTGILILGGIYLAAVFLLRCVTAEDLRRLFHKPARKGRVRHGS